MSFYEVYCSPTDGVIKGNIDGYLIMGLTVAIALIVAAIVRGARENV